MKDQLKNTNDIMETLKPLRREVAGKAILADEIITELVKEGIISKAEGTELKYLNKEKGASGSGSGRGKKGSIKFDFRSLVSKVQPKPVQVSFTRSSKSYKAPTVSRPQIKDLKFKGQPAVSHPQLKELRFKGRPLNLKRQSYATP